MSRYTEQTVADVRAMIPQFISGKRLAHTEAVERECCVLGACFSAHPTLFCEEDVMRLRIAALLHDITKERSTEEHARLCAQFSVPLSDMELRAPKVLHAKSAPPLARRTVNDALGAYIVDDAICDAIRTHTTGGEHMSLMGKLLYLADYIEDTRTFDDCVALRRHFYEDLDAVRHDGNALCAHLDQTLLMSFDMTIRDLLSHGAPIDPNTTAARNALLFSRS